MPLIFLIKFDIKCEQKIREYFCIMYHFNFEAELESLRPRRDS